MFAWVFVGFVSFCSCGGFDCMIYSLVWVGAFAGFIASDFVAG